MTPKTQEYITKLAQKGVSRINFNQYMPLGKRRKLTRSEELDIEEMSDRILPKIWQNKSTPLTELLSSPRKRAIAILLLSTGAGGGLGALGGGWRGILPGAITGAALGGIPATLSYYGKRSHNENILDYIHRLPRGATIRDMEADPVYQREQDRLIQAALPPSHQRPIY